MLLSALRAQRQGAQCGVLAGVSWTLSKLTIPLLVRRGILTVSNAVMLLGATLLLVRVDPVLAVVALSPALLMFLVARQFTARLGPRAQRLQQTISTLASTPQDSLAGIRAIKGLGLETVERQRELVQFNYHLLMLVGPLRIAGITLAQFERAIVSATLIASLLDVESTIQEPIPGRRRSRHDAQRVPAAVVADGLGSEIHFDSVAFGFGASAPLLERLELRIEPDETVALVGATGSGKTTLIGLIARFYDVTRGSVRLVAIGPAAFRPYPALQRVLSST